MDSLVKYWIDRTHQFTKDSEEYREAVSVIRQLTALVLNNGKQTYLDDEKRRLQESLLASTYKKLLLV